MYILSTWHTFASYLFKREFSYLYSTSTALSNKSKYKARRVNGCYTYYIVQSNSRECRARKFSRLYIGISIQLGSKGTGEIHIYKLKAFCRTNKAFD